MFPVLLVISQAYKRVGLTSSSTAALIYKMSSCCHKHLQNTTCLSAVALITIVIQNLRAEIFEYRFYSGPTSEST